MRLTFEFRQRYFQLETGRFLPETDELEEVDPTAVVHVPMGFTAIAPEEGTDDEWEDDETPEADCG